MDLDEVILVIDAQMPIRARRIKYFEDPALKVLHAGQAGSFPYPDEDGLRRDRQMTETRETVEKLKLELQAVRAAAGAQGPEGKCAAPSGSISLARVGSIPLSSLRPRAAGAREGCTGRLRGSRRVRSAVLRSGRARVFVHLTVSNWQQRFRRREGSLRSMLDGPKVDDGSVAANRVRQCSMSRSDCSTARCFLERCLHLRGCLEYFSLSMSATAAFMATKSGFRIATVARPTFHRRAIAPEQGAPLLDHPCKNRRENPKRGA